MASWWQRVRTRWSVDGPGSRTTGDPRSSNGASSFHLRWDLSTSAAFDRVEVTLEVLDPPTVPRLYFWALQVDVADYSGRPAGGAHLGLQWHPAHPGSTAVNWGGYDAGGTVLHGSESDLPSATANPHTRDLPWRPGRPYRLTVARVEPGPAATGPIGAVAWRGSVTDLVTGTTTVVRDLYPAGDRIIGVVMWSEVFARCDDPTVTVRWSAPTVRHLDGTVSSPRDVVCSYQSVADGGCTNTSSEVDGTGLVQRTAVGRAHLAGTRLTVPVPLV